MRCDEVAALLPSLVDGVDETNLAIERHVQECLRCQTDLVRYRKLVRNLELLRTRYIEPTPGLLGDTLAALTDAAERSAFRTIVTGRRLAYAGAIGGTAVATAATAALLIVRSRRRSGLSLAS
jgi:hypothetical protein